MKRSILIVEDLFIEANNLRLILDRAGYTVLPIASTFPEVMEQLERLKPDLVLLDIYLRGSLTGIDVAKILAVRKIPFIFLSANTNRKVFQAAKATKPYGFLVKPFRQRDVLAALEVAIELHDVVERGAMIEAGAGMASGGSGWGSGGGSGSGLGSGGGSGDSYNIITACRSMQNIIEHIRLVGPSEVTAIILGESGTGKELVANGIHTASGRKSAPFVVVNCGALPATLIESELFGHVKGAFTGAVENRVGKFEAAEGGTIFLDEIGELSPDLQVKFLRVLQEKEIQPVGGVTRSINVRVIAATNRRLDEEVAAGRFRTDLYYRLNVFPIVLPPLRERKEDIPLLANFFLKRFALLERKVINGFAADVMMAMERYSWPGNVREMENLMRRTVLLTKGPIVTEFYQKADLAFGIDAEARFSESESRVKSMAENERDHIVATLKACNWKVYGPGGAAELLAINVSTLNSRMKKLGIQKARPERK